MVVRFSRSRGRYERQGVLIEEPALERAEEECRADAAERRAKRERDRLLRAKQDRDLTALMIERIIKLFPACPPEEARAIAAHTGVAILPGLTKGGQDVYTSTMRTEVLEKQPAAALFDLPCACQNLRRVTRVVTRIYDQEMRKAGLEITQFGLLTALAATGEANQKQLSAGFAMDSTTLTRTLGLLRRQGWIGVRRGKDRRERLFRLTQAGKRQKAEAQPCWERAEQRLRRELGDAGWKSMKQTVSRITEAAMVA